MTLNAAEGAVAAAERRMVAALDAYKTAAMEWAISVVVLEGFDDHRG